MDNTQWDGIFLNIQPQIEGTPRVASLLTQGHFKIYNFFCTFFINVALFLQNFQYIFGQYMVSPEESFDISQNDRVSHCMIVF